MRILIVDDEAECHYFYSEVLEKHHTVFSAFDGLQAIELLQFQKIDFLITDHQMPKMDGIDLIKYIVDKKVALSTILMISGNLPTQTILKELKELSEGHFNFYVAEKNDDGLEQIKVLQSLAAS